MTRQEMLNGIDIKAGAVRSKYITTVPGQEATYILKGAQARRFFDNGFAGSPPNLVQAESDAVGESPKLAAIRILNEEEAWTNLAAVIEKIRRKGKIAVTAASSELEATTAYEQTISAFRQMMP